MATCHPVLGLGCTCTSWPSSARPSLIISANSSAANLVFCMARFQCSPQTIWQVRVLQTPLLLFPYFIRYLSAAPFVAAPAFFLQPENFARKCGASNAALDCVGIAQINHAQLHPDRRVISGILHVLKTGCRWRDVPPEYGPATTIYNRYNRWSQRGLWAAPVRADCSFWRCSSRTQPRQFAREGAPLGR